MNRPNSIKNAAVFAACLFCFAAASQVSAEQNEQEAIAVKVQSGKIDTRIANTSARQEGDSVVIEGVVRRTKETKGPLPVGCVDVSIRDGQGKTIEQTFSPIASTGAYRAGAVENHFATRIPTLVSQGSYVDVQYHNGSHRG
jgi:hypothetical protein